MNLVLAANAGVTIFGIIGFIGFCLLAIGIADGGDSAVLGLGLCVVALVGVGIFA